VSRTRIAIAATSAVVLALVLGGIAAAARTPSVAARAATTEPSRTITATQQASSTAGEAVDPSAFSPTACMAFPPTVGNRHLTVFLDAGHGGIDPGAVGTTESGQTIYEADQTLPVEMDAMAMLRREGFAVVVSRTTATTVVRLTAGDVSDGVLTVQGSHDDVAARDVCANQSHANILIGIYFDAGSANNAGSVTGYDTARPFEADNLKLATLVQNDVLASMNTVGSAIPDEGVIQDEQLGSSITSKAASYGHLLLLGPAEAGYFSTPSQMPGALIEPLFITDPFEGSIADSNTGQNMIAAGLAQAVNQYFSP
jgi:N-acetylmuramoyl-L-alanine amidase